MCQALNGSADATGNRTHELLALVKLTCRLNKIKKEKNMARQAGAGAAGAGENRSRERAQDWEVGRQGLSQLGRCMEHVSWVTSGQWFNSGTCVLMNKLVNITHVQTASQGCVGNRNITSKKAL